MLQIDSQKIADICEKYKITYLGLFGSHARQEAKEGSDVDLLVEYAPETPVKSLFDLFDVEEDFKSLFGREVDLVKKDLLHPYVSPFVYRELKTLYSCADFSFSKGEVATVSASSEVLAPHLEKVRLDFLEQAGLVSSVDRKAAEGGN
ncbi:hypothetical protein GF360_03975 [candidate division WWE3 bacterium]|nr:hypothetical protein [candidate division WWE3 bacterium]